MQVSWEWSSHFLLPFLFGKIYRNNPNMHLSSQKTFWLFKNNRKILGDLLIIFRICYLCIYNRPKEAKQRLTITTIVLRWSTKNKLGLVLNTQKAGLYWEDGWKFGSYHISFFLFFFLLHTTLNKICFLLSWHWTNSTEAGWSCFKTVSSGYCCLSCFFNIPLYVF